MNTRLSLSTETSHATTSVEFRKCEHNLFATAIRQSLLFFDENETPIYNPRSVSRTAATSKVKLFVIIFNGFQPLTIIPQTSTFDVAAVINPPLNTKSSGYKNS